MNRKINYLVLFLLTLSLFFYVYQNSEKTSIAQTNPIETIVNNIKPKDSLRSLATKKKLSMGTSVNIDSFRQDPTYREVLAREFNLMTPENYLKFGYVQPERDRYNFTDADELITFAKNNKMQVHGHVLVWHQSLPKWLTEGKWTRDEAIAILKKHIQTVVGHYRGQIAVWDVVNEAVDKDGSLRDSFWLKKIGSEYIEMAFLWAHEADPDAILLYNDHDNEALNRKSDGIYSLVKDLRNKKVPIDGVGFQMHKSIAKPPNPRKVTANLKRLNELGLDVQITEMDVQIYEGQGGILDRLASQATVYEDMMGVCLQASKCSAFIVWGLSDRDSWIPYFFSRPDFPVLFDYVYRPKPAYDALVKVFKN